jgi:penicillin-binding protein activator
MPARFFFVDILLEFFNPVYYEQSCFPYKFRYRSFQEEKMVNQDLKHLRLMMVMILIALFVGIGCTPKRVTRVSSSEVTDLSGRWNDTDSRLVSRGMIDDVLSRNWLSDFSQKERRKPRVIVGTVVNRSHEHIATRSFVKDLERELINSGRISFVASKGERQELRQERQDQQTQSSAATAKRLAQEKAADFMLKGSILTILDELKGTKIKFYQINLELINIEDNEKVWIGEKKIKKIVEKDGYGL